MPLNIFFKDMSCSIYFVKYIYTDVLTRGSVAVDSLLIVAAYVGFCVCSIFCCTLLFVLSGFAIILMGTRELVALLCLSSWCLVALPHDAVGWSAVCDCGIF